MNLSSEPSIETLPDFYRNGVVETSVVNDQTIANYCSDTVRELNNLTEELKQTDLDDIGRCTENNINHFSDRFKENTMNVVHNDVRDSVHMLGNNQLNTHSATADNNSEQSILQYNCNATKIDRALSEVIDNGKNCDVVDSSPFYNNQHVDSNLGNASNGINAMANDAIYSQNTFAYANGNVGGDLMDDDEYRMSACMLQSVDLRGKF